MIWLVRVVGWALVGAVVGVGGALFSYGILLVTYEWSPLPQLLPVANGIVGGWAAARYHPSFAVGYIAVVLGLLWLVGQFAGLAGGEPFDMLWPSAVAVVAAGITYVVDWLVKRKLLNGKSRA